MNNTVNNTAGKLVKGKRQKQEQPAKTSVVKPLPLWFMQALEVARAAGFAIPRKWKLDLPVIQF